MLAEPPLTRYDIHFKLFGFPVRVSPFFWLAGLVLGLRAARTDLPLSMGDKLGIFGIFIACMFISILIHELGHALLIRRFGWGSRIILYHFGGLATFESPESYLPMHNENESSPGRKIIIALAGPAAGFLLAAVVIVVLLFADVGFAFYFSKTHIIGIKMPELENLRLRLIAYNLLLLNIFWGLFNLLPVYPLDGGQVARELFTLKNPRKGIEYSLILSAIVGAVAAVIALVWKQWDGLFFGLMFGILAFGSYQTLQRYKQQFGEFGGGGDDYDDADWWKR